MWYRNEGKTHTEWARVSRRMSEQNSKQTTVRRENKRHIYRNGKSVKETKRKK